MAALARAAVCGACVCPWSSAAQTPLRGAEKTCTSLLGPRAAGITAGYRRGDEASWELLMRFGAESLLSRAAAASTSTSAKGAASFS